MASPFSYLCKRASSMFSLNLVQSSGGWDKSVLPSYFDEKNIYLLTKSCVGGMENHITISFQKRYESKSSNN